jgi:glycosyltransferase involved in cell wall biosynthesis
MSLRGTKYCIVIPVINEGKRIRSLLRRMYALGLDTFADIVIVDGGSTDGSLASDAIEMNRIGAILTKTGPGKLSAQLRCAYAFALIKGYEGIVTIDGNDKDDPASMPEFFRQLDNGIDFVQASRFRRGGNGVHTPLLRWLAIRLLHAPALSLASHFYWTDTTQGYRAYRASMLLDPLMGIFRDIFRDYELLAYMNYRAPRLKYVCMEIATTRRYPANEAIPTKIGGWRGNLRLIEILKNTCLGRYNP